MFIRRGLLVWGEVGEERGVLECMEKIKSNRDNDKEFILRIFPVVHGCEFFWHFQGKWNELIKLFLNYFECQTDVSQNVIPCRERATGKLSFIKVLLLTITIYIRLINWSNINFSRLHSDMVPWVGRKR